MSTLDELLPDPKNRRKHTEPNRKMIRDSLLDVGPARSIVIDEENVVLAGNGVVDAAKELGLSKVRIVDAEPDELIAVRKTGLDAEGKRRLAMYDNRTAELAEWDAEQLSADRDAGLDLAPFFSEVELARELGLVLTPGRTSPDAVPEPRSTSIRLGDLFALGDHRLLCGDATKREDVHRAFDSRRAEMCFTSPPYADQRQYTGDTDLSVEHLSKFIPAAEPWCDLFCVNLGIVRRKHFVVRYWDAYIERAETAGLGLLSWNVWSREGGQMSVGQVSAMFPIQHEWIFVFGRERVALLPTIENKSAGRVIQTVTDREPDGTLTRKRPLITREKRELGTVITLPQVQNNAEHPAQFPVTLPIAYLSSVVGPAYEPFAGSGTTIIAAEQLGRPCIAIEIAPKYCQVAIDRWEAFTGRTAEKIGTG